MPIFHVFWGDQAKFFRFPLEYHIEWASFGQGRKTKFAFPLYTVETGTKFRLRFHCIQGKRKFRFSSLVLEWLLNFWIFGTYFKLIAYLFKIREPPKVKKSKIRVTRKPDLETQNWVYSFSSFIEPYQTCIVTVQMLSTFFHLLDRVMTETPHGKLWKWVLRLLTSVGGNSHQHSLWKLLILGTSCVQTQTAICKHVLHFSRQ